MRYILTFLVLFATVAGLRAANPGDEVVVIYNKSVPESKGVADHYAELRHVPMSQVFGFKMPTNESISRAQYQDSLEKPLAKELESQKLWHVGSEIIPGTNNTKGKVVWKVQRSKIRYAVLCYGVPYRILEDASRKEETAEKLQPELRRNGAAVDSELALLPILEQNYPLVGPRGNAFYTATNAAWFHPTNGILMVTRLDGPSAEIARGLVDKALEGETNGLCGRAYVDLRDAGTNTAYHVGDEWMLGAAKICQYFGGYDTVVETNAATFSADFPMSQIAFYCGWYDENVSGPFAQPKVEFMPGAFAYHLHSYSASVLRSPTQRWVGPLLAKGAAVTMGSIDEPYISGTPDVSVFAARWIALGFTFGEAAYACQQTLSWQTTVIGDPLYRPFGRSFQEMIEDQQSTKSKWLEWQYLRGVNVGLLRGRRPAEMSQFLESIPLTRQSAVLSEKLGDLYNAEGKPASTIEAYEFALKDAPSPLQRVRLRLYLANVLVKENKPQEAADSLKKLLAEMPDYPGKATVEKRIEELANKGGEKTTAPAGANP
jgi:uncharacterized protein (TIGR03790 family)